ncbi:MAG: GNAT family N-acetyltransferase [bacterium]|nr:GNAT family N-acetyltransferase [bacterium]
MKLIKALTSDIPTISSLAYRIWKQVYPDIISQEQIDYMLQLMYSNESLSEQMGAKAHLFYLIELESECVGFVSVSNESPNNWHLNKFYIDQKVARKGLGTEVLADLLRLLQAKQMTLTVNRQNYKAINFYFKNGFRIERVADFNIGNGYVMNDFVMMLEI